MTAGSASPTPARAPLWPWAALAAAAVWTVAVRLPLILNAPVHLDSDLAVDGLTLLDFTRGHPRWHYPGTPYIGSLPVLLSLPQALALGATPATLVSGGTVAALGLLLATFLLARKVFGPVAAVGALVPLTFASNGAVWLSGRITGGHLMAAVWHAGAFALLSLALSRGDRRSAAGLGLWVGLGWWLDSMTLLTVAGLVPAAVLTWLLTGARPEGWALAGVFLVAALAGATPRFVGTRVDPYNAYEDQFSPVFQADVLAEHARLLGAECLPRLLAGHKLPGYATDPDPNTVGGPPGSAPASRYEAGSIAYLATWLTLGLAVTAALALLRVVVWRGDPVARAVAGGLLVSAAAALAGFVVNRNIFNSDNYRYLVTVLVPWAVGFGVWTHGVVRRGAGGALLGLKAAVVLAVVMTVDLRDWYARLGWVEGVATPVRRPLDDAALRWLDGHPDVNWVDGGYWDVYRLSFLTGGRVRGAPFPVYPNRFPDWRPGAGASRAVFARATPEGAYFRDEAVKAGGRVVERSRGLTVVLPR